MAVSAQQGQNVYKEATTLQERGVGTEGRQLQFLEEGKQKKVKDLGPKACPWTGRGGQRSPLHSYSVLVF